MRGDTAVILVITAMALAVAFATRGAMAGSRHIVEVLHFVGAEDRFIAGEFQRLFFRGDELFLDFWRGGNIVLHDKRHHENL